MLKTVLCCVLAFGCAHSSREIYGNEARYSADGRAWVARNGDKAWVFRNPVTGCVLRCRSDVERWSKLNATLSHTTNKNDGAIGTPMLATFPLAIPAAILFLPTIGVSQALKAPSASSWRAQGEELWKKGALEEAANAFRLAVAEGDRSAGEPLAEVLIRLGRVDDAVEARRMLICRGADLGDTQWHRIESWLGEHGSAMAACSDPSTEPLPITWEE